MLRLLFASGCALVIRARRLVTGEAAVTTGFAIVVLLILLRAAILAVSGLDSAAIDRAPALGSA
ncbi:MAG: hypothetical protein H0V12_05745 [Chloroflexi bacterium]|nr:hypothetical protein [Chloroflexota bacterium]